MDGNSIKMAGLVLGLCLGAISPASADVGEANVRCDAVITCKPRITENGMYCVKCTGVSPSTGNKYEIEPCTSAKRSHQERTDFKKEVERQLQNMCTNDRIRDRRGDPLNPRLSPGITPKKR